MNNEECTDIVIEALEVFLNHILYARDIYPAQIFKIRQVYNTPIYVSIFPPLNAYLLNVLRTARQLRSSKELQSVELLLYRNELELHERYTFDMSALLEMPLDSSQLQKDEFLLDFEEQLRTSLYMISERLKALQKLPSDVKFKVLLHTTQSGFVRLSHNSHYQDFPWLHEALRSERAKEKIRILPLTKVNRIGLGVMCEVL